jgi:DHA2 family multidrug resistance protein
MNGETTFTAEQTVWQPRVNPWIIGVVVALAAFMEVLDTSIANVALPHMAGDLGASNNESTWVLTSYLVANAIILPASGWLVSVFGRKRLFMTCIAFFTISSFLCGISSSLGFLLLARILQGAFGGGLQPMAQAVLADSFPPEKRGLAFALYGVTAVCAPAIGPTLGGWITDSFSWRWIFFINIPVGILTLVLVYMLLEDPPYLKELKRGLASFDAIGFSLLVLGVGALQILLDKGQEDDWFGSRFITALVVLSVVSFISLVVWEWHHKEPIVDVRLFKNFSFAIGNVMFLMLGISLMASTVLIPQFLQTLMGYTAQQAGMVLTSGALVTLLSIPIIGKLTTLVQARYLIAFGWITMAASLFISSRENSLTMSFNGASWLRILQSFPMAFLFIPITLAGYVGLAANKNNAASGIMNFMRNIGQSIGTSTVTTLIARRTQFHQTILSEHTSSGHFQATVAGLESQLSSAGLGDHAAHRQAVGRLYFMLQSQATALSYVDVYWILGIGSAMMFFLSFMMRKNELGKGENMSVH